MIDNFEEKLTYIAKNLLEEIDLELYELKIIKTKRRTDIEIYIDKKEGYVSLEDCEKASKILDVKIGEIDEYLTKYNLIVSSPGINRKLRNIKEFTKFINSYVKIILIEAKNNKKILKGYIEKIDELNNKVFIKINNISDVYEIDYDNIKKANLEIDI